MGTLDKILSSIIGLAILAIIVSKKAQTGTVIQSIASGFASILGTAVAPISAASTASAAAGAATSTTAAASASAATAAAADPAASLLAAAQSASGLTALPWAAA